MTGIRWLSLLAAALFVCGPVEMADAETGTAVSVRDLGARGDGKRDDTAAFVKAVRRAEATGKQVFVPRGQYKLTRTIELNSLGICGPDVGAWPADCDSLPSLVIAHHKDPAIRLLGGGAVRGLDISYRWDREPTTGPAAILISGVGASVSDVRIRYAWDGILADGTSNVGRTNIENVFMAAVRNCGVRMTGTWDVPRLSNVEVWNPQAQQPSNWGLSKGVGFHLGKNDLIRLTDCFVFGMQVGFLLENKIPGCTIEGETWGVMNGCATDFCGYGMKVIGDHTISASGCSFWNHQESLLVEQGKSRIRISGSELKSNGSPAVNVRSCDHTVITGCSLLRNMKEHTSPAVVLAGGRTVLGANYIESFGTGVQIEPGAGTVTMEGNIIESHGKPEVTGQKK